MEWNQVKLNGMPVARDKKKNYIKAIKKVEQNENYIKRAFQAVVSYFHVSAYAVYQAAACSVFPVCVQDSKEALRECSSPSEQGCTPPGMVRGVYKDC